MNPLISIVIPVYNVEKFLRGCMDTVLKQTYDNFEVVMVDDGSTDSSPEICDEYARLDGRVSVYHKENGGVSDARNYGIRRANADLIAMVDPDDYPAIDYLEYLYELMRKTDADMSWACVRTTFCYDETINEFNGPFKEQVLEPEEALERMCLYGDVSVCAKLYKKEMLLNNPYPVGRLYEDAATTYKIIGSCRKIAISDKVVYCYLQREGSTMHSEINDRQYDVIWAADNQLKYIKENYPEAIIAANVSCAMSGLRLIDCMFTYGCNDRKSHFQRVRNYMNPYMRETLTNGKVQSKTRLYCLIVYLGYLPSKLFWWVKNRLKRMAGRVTI